MTTHLPLRSEVPLETTWDLASVFETVDIWEKACTELVERLPALKAYQGKLGVSPAHLLQFINKMSEAGEMIGKISVFAHNQYAINTGDQTAAAMAGQAASLHASYEAAIAFFEPELVEIGFERLNNWLEEEPKLSFLRHFVDHLKKHQQHVRSAEVEEVLAMTGDPFSGAFRSYTALTSADLRFKNAITQDDQAIEVGQANYRVLEAHSDRVVRKTAWESYSDGYLAYKNTLSSVLSTALKQDVFNAKTRGFSSSLEAALGSTDIPVAVYHNLLQVFQANLPTWHRYWKIRRRLLGYERLHVYDIKAPLSGNRPSIPYEQAVDWICEGMAPMGSEYVQVLRKGCLEERWVDRARNKGKRDGAFSSGSYGTHPFIMMSYADDIFSVSTLAHELGHSMHSYYTRKTQPFIYSRYGLFVAEVASNFNQAMVRDYLFKNVADRDFQLSLIDEAMSNFHRYFFIMPMLAQFELEMHQRIEAGQPVSADVMVGSMARLFQTGYGEEVDFDRDRIGITWAQFLHMYMNFYVYQYATGISGAQALASNVLSNQPQAVENYLRFLSLGGSMDPLDSLKLAGVDLESSEPVEKAFAMLSDLVDRLESLT